jgi:hypothetical protein
VVYLNNYKEDLFMTDTILSNEVVRNAMRMQFENISQQIGKASDKLPKELWEKVFEFDSKLNTIMAITQEFYFRQGINTGLTKLQFLSEMSDANV